MNSKETFLFGTLTIFIICVGFSEAVEKKYGCVLPKEPWYGTFKFNDQRRSLKYVCDEGYFLTGGSWLRDRECRRGRWTGQSRDCIAKFSSECPVLRTPKHGTVIVEGRKVGESANYFCDAGYVLEGSPSVTCLVGYRWSGTFPYCRSQQTMEDFANHMKDTMIDSLSGATADSETGAQSRLSPGKSGLDIVLLVDVSSSIGPQSLESAKKFMKVLVDLFGVSSEPSGGKNGTRFALVTFSNEAKVVFNLNNNTARTKSQVKTIIDAIENTGGGTDFRKAFSKVASAVYFAHIFDTTRDKHATRAIFLITDAEETSTLAADRMERIESQVNILKTAGNFEIFSIGVGQNIDKFVLSSIASDPKAEHVFLIDQFKDLEKIGDIIAEKNIDYGQCGISGLIEIPQGAQDSKKGAWPWLGWLSVVNDNGVPSTCGGSLLCDRWFLTSASCVSRVVDGKVVPYNATQINLFLSDHLLSEKDDNEVWPWIEEVLLHPNYTGVEIADLGVREFDVALLDLGNDNQSTPVLNKFLRPICFPADNQTYSTADALLKVMLSFPKKKPGHTAGWGHAPDTANHIDLLSDRLKQNERPLQKRKVCRDRYPDLDLDKFFCVGDEFVESDSCAGDIGGPYMVEMGNNRLVAMGLALSTRYCQIKYRFSIFLNLVHPTITEWVALNLDGCNRVHSLNELEN